MSKNTPLDPRPVLRKLIKQKATPCEHVTGDKYCPKCGKQLQVDPVDWFYIIEQFYKTWMLKAFRDTLLGLSFHPGHSVRKYLQNDRDLIIKPIAYIAACATFFVWINSVYPDSLACDKLITKFCQFFMENTTMVQLIQAVCLCITIKFIFYRNSKYNFFEILVFSIFLLAQILLFSTLLTIANHFVGGSWRFYGNLLAKMVFSTVALVQFFEQESFKGYLKALFCFMLSSFIFLTGLTFYVTFSLEMETP